MNRSLLALFLLLLSAGCSPSEDNETAAPDRQQEPAQEKGDGQSAVGKVVDEVTGIRAAQQGAELKDKINTIEAQRNREIEDALGEE